MTDTIKIYTSIKPELLKRRLLRGTLLALAGAALFCYAGIALSLTELDRWGIAILAVSFTLITLGLLPYRRLSLLATAPQHLLIHDNGTLQFLTKKDTPAFTVPFASIDHMEYYDKGNTYGIGIKLKDPIPDKVVVNDPAFGMNAFHKQSQRQVGCDLFFPYFGKDELDELHACLAVEED